MHVRTIGLDSRGVIAPGSDKPCPWLSALPLLIGALPCLGTPRPVALLHCCPDHSTQTLRCCDAHNLLDSIAQGIL
jgi:hypothetical protein